MRDSATFYCLASLRGSAAQMMFGSARAQAGNIVSSY
jgi:hypothetical protein